MRKIAKMEFRKSLIWLRMKLLKAPLIFLLFYLLVGLGTIKQYGLPIDDFTQYVIGKVNYEYLIGERKNEEIEVEMRYYGPAFETLCYAIDCEFDEEPQPTQKWGMRHGLIFLFFTIALGCLYLIVKQLYNSKKIAWVIMLMLALYPRVFADAHYNSKDTLFLSLVTIALYPLMIGLRQNRCWLFVISGLIFGLATTIRLSAFFIIPSVFVTWVFYALYHSSLNKKLLLNLFLFIGVWFFSYYAFFPALWKHPVSEFITLVKRMQQFPWPNETLVAGKWVGPQNRVWWYLPVWMGITLPIAYLLLFGMMLFPLFLSLKKKKIHLNIDDFIRWFVAIWFFSTLIFVMVTKPNLYDSWRQFQYLVVPFLILCGIGILFLLQFSFAFKFMILMLVYQLGVLIYMNPFQQVYFNEGYWIFGKPHTYDQDYWHVTTEHCVDWLDRQRFKKPIKIFTRKSNAAWLNLFFYQNHQNRQFFATDSVEVADYEIVPVRNNEYFDSSRNEVYSVCPLKDTIARIVKLK